MTNHKIDTKTIVTPWFVRLALYVIVGAVGLVLTVLGIVDPAQVDSWLGQIGSLAALIGGVIAATHTGRHSDNTVPVVIDEPVAPEPPAPVDHRAALAESEES